MSQKNKANNKAEEVSDKTKPKQNTAIPVKKKKSRFMSVTERLQVHFHKEYV